MVAFLLTLHVLLGLSLVTLVLLQHGKGADAGAAFGSGASATVFGARGVATFLSKTTAVLATLFFFTSLGLGYLFLNQEGPGSVMERAPVEEVQLEQSAPADEQAAPEQPGAEDMPGLPD